MVAGTVEVPADTVWAGWVELFDRQGVTLQVLYAVTRAGVVMWYSDGAWLEELDVGAADAVRRTAAV